MTALASKWNSLYFTEVGLTFSELYFYVIHIFLHSLCTGIPLPVHRSESSEQEYSHLKLLEPACLVPCVPHFHGFQWYFSEDQMLSF